MCCTALRHQQTARLQPAAPAQGRPAALICPQRAARERGKERSDYREVFKLIQQQPRKCLPRTVRSIVVPLLQAEQAEAGALPVRALARRTSSVCIARGRLQAQRRAELAGVLMPGPWRS